MDDSKLLDLNQIRLFLEGSYNIEFLPIAKEDRYEFIRNTLIRLKYLSCNRKDKGIIIRYLKKMTTYSRQQVTRLIKKYRLTGFVKRSRVNQKQSGFKRKYLPKDMMLLVKTDEAHETLSGPATKKLLERAYCVFDQKEYQNIANISVAHIYNLRHSDFYTRQRRSFDKTKPVRVAIGERRKPAPTGKPGFLRVDTVHQGDLDKEKGVYHINAVDEITQFELVFAVEKISERFLTPILEMLLNSFPFKILNFHSDNGKEYINYKVVSLLNRMLIKLTKSRARKSNDNALVECKNGAIVRKYLGYVYIKQKCAPIINVFYQQHLNLYLNYHRPCFYPEETTDNKGKIKKVYKYESMMTPYEKLKSLKDAEQYLKPNITFEILDTAAMRINDMQAAQELKLAQKQMFKSIGDMSK